MADARGPDLNAKPDCKSLCTKCPAKWPDVMSESTMQPYISQCHPAGQNSLTVGLQPTFTDAPLLIRVAPNRNATALQPSRSTPKPTKPQALQGRPFNAQAKGMMASRLCAAHDRRLPSKHNNCEACTSGAAGPS